MQKTETEDVFQVGVDQIIKGIQQLDDQALTQVAGEVTRLLSKRGAQAPIHRERLLLKKIKTAIPAAVRRRQRQLYSMLQEGTLKAKEHEELLLFNHLLEEKSAERILLIGELAKLRGVTVEQLMADLTAEGAHAKA